MYFWVSTLILFVALAGCSDLRDIDTPMVCRDGKAYVVVPHGDITLYSPTYDECEVTSEALSSQ